MAGVLIRGFDFDTDAESIRRHCATAGQVMSIQMKGKGGAMVTYKSEVAAARAVAKLDQSIIPGNTRYIDAQQKSGGGQGVSSAAKTAAQRMPKAIIKPVTTKMVWDTPSGQVTTGKGKGNGKAVLPKYVAVNQKHVQPAAKKRAVASEPKGDAKSCYVRGMDLDTAQEDILDYLSSAGEIVSSKFGKKNTNVLVTYADKESAAFAVETLNKTSVPGNERYIDVIIHKAKNEANGSSGTSAKKQRNQGEKGPSGPNLERERLTTGPITGTVISFRGSFGWIQPDEPFEHEKANSKHKGKIYAHKQDVAAGTLAKDEQVQFEVFADSSGLGAEDVVTL